MSQNGKIKKKLNKYNRYTKNKFNIYQRQSLKEILCAEIKIGPLIYKKIIVKGRIFLVHSEQGYHLGNCV